MTIEATIFACVASFFVGKIYSDWRRSAEIEAVRNDAGQIILSMMEMAEDKVENERNAISYRSHMVWVEAARKEAFVTVDGHNYSVHEQFVEENNNGMD